MAEIINDNSLQTDPSSQNETSTKTNREKNHRSRALWLFTFLLIVAGSVWFSYWYLYLQYHESTDDAYAHGNFIQINSVISGAVIAYYADNTDLVKEGQLLVELDKTNYQSNYEKELAKLAEVTLMVKQLYSNVKAQFANVKNQRAALERTKYDYNSRLKLKETTPQALSQEDFVHAQQNFLEAQFKVLQSESLLNVALAAAGNTIPQFHPQIENQKANVRIAYYNLRHCSIYAPQTGYIAQRGVEVGQWITPNTNLMAIIPTDYVWVDANFKETQLKKMRVGQPATISFDLYGSDVIFKGKVIGIASGTGSIFSLIPPQNATGNWIKIVQRLPVRISLEQKMVEKYPIRLGISAEVDVDITNQDLPLLSTLSPEKPVAKTSIYNIHMKDVNQIMDEIVQSNLELKSEEEK